MGLRSFLKRAFFRAVRLYDLPYEVYVSSKGRERRSPLLLKQGPSPGMKTQAIRIWCRNLQLFKEIPAVGRLGHWCIQVGGTYFELLIPDGETKLVITAGPNHPFHGYRYKAFPKTSSTTFTPEQVCAAANRIYTNEFEDHYGAGVQDCQRFVMRLFEEVCVPEDEHEVDASYFKSFSFAAAYSTASPPTHITHPSQYATRSGHATTPTPSSVRSHTARGHGSSSHGASRGGSIASQGWFLNMIAMPPPR